MSKVRKPNNNRARLERASRAALRQSKLAVYNVDPAGRQGLCNWETAAKYRPSRHVADAIFDMSHQWVIYISAFCRDQGGRRYYKSVEIAPHGIYHTDALAGVLDEHYRALLDSCNPAHIVGSGWIANPCGHALDEAGAARIFEAVDAWKQPEPIELVDPPKCHMKPMRLAGDVDSRHWRCQHCSHTKPIEVAA